MSPSVLRARTIDLLKRRRERFGDDHPATIAAYARADIAWQGRNKLPEIDNEKVFEVAKLRAMGYVGYMNRRVRKCG